MRNPILYGPGNLIYIELTDGSRTAIDVEYYYRADEIAGSWYALHRNHTSYAYTRIAGTTVYLHRWLLQLEPGDGTLVDHINRDGLDNARDNLRIADATVNAHNQRGHGVRWHARSQKYEAFIRFAGVQHYLGLHETRAQARTAYLEAKRVMHPSSPIPQQEQVAQ